MVGHHVYLLPTEELRAEASASTVKVKAYGWMLWVIMAGIAIVLMMVVVGTLLCVYTRYKRKHSMVTMTRKRIIVLQPVSSS